MHKEIMMTQYRRACILLSLVVSALTPLPAAPAIGTASTRGAMEVDHTSVRGTANLFEGSSVRTGDTSGQIRLRNGVQATFEGKTAAAVYSDRIELQAGTGQIATRVGFDVGALGFRISPDGGKAVTRVFYERPDRILVTALESSVAVRRGGVLLARLSPGTTYYFEPDSPQSGDTAQSAGKTAGKTGATAAKGALSAGAKFGIVAGSLAAAGTGIGLGVALSGDDTSR
jgi:hypothetical protein